MNELDEIKNTYLELVDSAYMSESSMLEVADKYINEEDKMKRDIYAAYLIVYCWPAIERLYYKQNVKVLSVADCYDIFLDSFLYVMEKHVWKDPEHSLYNDEDAILKAMYVLVDSRRKNYFISQNRQKRVVNQRPVSLDTLSEDFQEGYFSPVIETYNFNRGWENEFVLALWDNKLYIASIILDIILNLDVFDEESMSIKKIKKYLKNITEEYYCNFLDRYDILDDDLIIFHAYLEDIDDDVLYTHIRNTINMFKESLELRKIKEDHVD